jgi:hypothetical protein
VRKEVIYYGRSDLLGIFEDFFNEDFRASVSLVMTSRAGDGM